MKTAAILFALACTGCSTVEYRPGSALVSENGVRVLYEHPQDVKFKSLGTIQAEVYQPGFKAPTVADVMPKLLTKAATAGGNAVIVRNNQVGQFDRSISVTAEVLLVEWPKP